MRAHERFPATVTPTPDDVDFLVHRIVTRPVPNYPLRIEVETYGVCSLRVIWDNRGPLWLESLTPPVVPPRPEYQTVRVYG